MDPRQHPPPTSSVLSVRGLHAGYPVGLGLRSRDVLHGLELELDGTRRLGVAGPNGSGKSTLMHVLAGIDPVRRGTVEVFGAPPADAAVRRRVGFLPEESPFPPELHALAAMELLGSLAGLAARDARRRGAVLLERVGLGAQLDTRLGHLSRGMLRRFGLAQAVLNEPDLILLDEPAAGLDAAGFVVLQHLLEEATERGARVVICSHLAGEVLADCERIVCLVEGRIVADAPPAEIVGGDGGLLGLYRRHADEPGHATGTGGVR